MIACTEQGLLQLALEIDSIGANGIDVHDHKSAYAGAFGFFQFYERDLKSGNAKQANEDLRRFQSAVAHCEDLISKSRARMVSQMLAKIRGELRRAA
jgi:hypothetical protein